MQRFPRIRKIWGIEICFLTVKSSILFPPHMGVVAADGGGGSGIPTSATFLITPRRAAIPPLAAHPD